MFYFNYDLSGFTLYSVHLTFWYLSPFSIKNRVVRISEFKEVPDHWRHIPDRIWALPRCQWRNALGRRSTTSGIITI